MWRDNMRTASFRGVHFLVLTGETTVGRRIARHEYPQRDVPYMEDMGRKAREYKVDAYVLGPDYMPGRDSLIDALEEPGAGQLVHPWHGEKLVTVASSNFFESTQDGGYCRVTIEFVEAGEENEPHTTPDTDAAVEQSGNDLLASAESDFARSFSLKKMPDWAVFDAESALSSLLMAAGLAGSFALLRGLFDSPVALASALAGRLDTVKNPEKLATFAIPEETIKWHTTTRGAITRNRRALIILTRAAGTKKAILQLTKIEAPTLDEAASARAEIVVLTDSLIFTPDCGVATSDAAIRLRSLAIAHFMAITPYLPRIARITPFSVRPALVHAHDFYGDAWVKDLREAEIVRRNSVKHPGFVPSGRALELIA
jgi:prophage DNA circulation protein